MRENISDFPQKISKILKNLSEKGFNWYLHSHEGNLKGKSSKSPLVNVLNMDNEFFDDGYYSDGDIDDGYEGDTDAIVSQNKMKELDLKEKSSKSLLANVLDMDDDYRPSSTLPQVFPQHHHNQHQQHHHDQHHHHHHDQHQHHHHHYHHH